MSGPQIEMHFMRDEKGNWKEMAPKNSAKLAINMILDGGTVTAEELAALLRAQADALYPLAGVEKPKKKKASKKDEEESNDDSDSSDSDSGDDESDSTSGDDDSSDADEGASEEDSESEDGESGDDESSDDTEDSESEDGESEAGPSKKDCIGLLKKLATKKNKKTAMAIMKKVTGKDSIHDVSAKQYGKLADALKKAAK